LPREDANADAAAKSTDGAKLAGGAEKRKYMSVTADLKYQFFDIHRVLHHRTLQETCDWINTELDPVYEGELSVDQVRKWRKQLETRPEKEKEEVQEKKKRGPKKRELKLGEFKPWNNTRVSVATLTMLAALLVAQVVAGIPLSTPVILCSARAVFSSAGVTWEPKTSWARVFATRIGLSLRKGTQAARHLPANFEQIKHLHILRFVWLVSLYGLQPCFVFNLDETGVRFMPLKGKTWGEKGAKQISITGLDDKRQFTAFPIINAAGELCGHVQLTWQGTTLASCPKSACQTIYSNTLTHHATKSHWSTPTTVEAHVDDLYESYFLPKCKALGLKPAVTYWMICWDVYSSHREKALLARLKIKSVPSLFLHSVYCFLVQYRFHPLLIFCRYPMLIVLFIPASCTGELQPLDVGFNGPWKTWITHFACLWLAGDIRRQLASNPDPTKVRVGMKKSDLVEPFCGWIADATSVMKDKNAMLLRCWEKTGVFVAWQYGSAELRALLEEANKLHTNGELWKPFADKTYNNGTVSRTRLVCDGVLNDIGKLAAASLGGFGDADMEEDAGVEEPVDFVAVGDPQAQVDENEEEGKQEKENQMEEIENEKEKEPEEKEDELVQQLPAKIAQHFAQKATRSGRVPKKNKKYEDAA
jgi:hypothetical protein